MTLSFTHLPSHPVRQQKGVHTRHRAGRRKNQLKYIQEGLLVQSEFRINSDLVVFQNQMQHKARVPVGSP